MNEGLPSNYTPLYPEIFRFDKGYFDDELNASIESGDKERILSIFEPLIHGVFAFKCLKKEYCEKMVQEMKIWKEKGSKPLDLIV
jgi:hypothetical protein